MTGLRYRRRFTYIDEVIVQGSISRYKPLELVDYVWEKYDEAQGSWIPVPYSELILLSAFLPRNIQEDPYKSLNTTHKELLDAYTVATWGGYERN